MAVTTQTSPSKEANKPIEEIAPQKGTEIQMKNTEEETMVKSESEVEQQQQSAQPPPQNPQPSNAKRTRGAGVNGKTCHQCRQKTMAAVATCKAQKGNGRNCTLMFCKKCLLNRYGENADEMNELSEWNCPKCRGICNCSLCMKKRGHQPTGMLVHTAKATGFSSVSEMLQVQGFEAADALNRKRKAASQDQEGNSGNQTPSDGNIDLNLDTNENKSRKFKRSKLESSNNDYQEEVSTEPCLDGTETKAEPVRDADVQMKQSRSTPNDGNGEEEDDSREKMESDEETLHNLEEKPWKSTSTGHDVPLPVGAVLANVAGVNLPTEDVGNALQFLEFCEAFREVLDIKEGQSESILRELADHRSTRQEQYSEVVQFHTKMINLIRKDMGQQPMLSSTSDGDSWSEAFGRCISDTLSAFSNFPSDCFRWEGIGYHTLDPSKKLRLLNLLCDESLGTSQLRDWIDVQNPIHAQRSKEAKEKCTAAKEKERLAKHKMWYEMASAFASKDIGGPSSFSARQNLISMLKDEASKAHNETLEAEGMLHKIKQRSDAQRTEPLMLDGGAQLYPEQSESLWVFWRLACHTNKSTILRQDIRNMDSPIPEEKWSSYDEDSEGAVDDYISTICKNRRQRQVVRDRNAQERKKQETDDSPSSPTLP